MKPVLLHWTNNISKMKRRLIIVQNIIIKRYTMFLKKCDDDDIVYMVYHVDKTVKLCWYSKNSFIQRINNYNNNRREK